MALISLKDVTLGFGGPPLLDGVDLHVEAGDRMCLLGRNGVGKSSVLRLIAGRQLPDGGQVAVGRDIRVSYLEQGSRAAFEGTALEYCRAESSGELAALKYLTRLDIDAESKFETLSGGGQRRVMLAAVLAIEADVVLLDEPTNHLDIDTVLWLEEHLCRQVKTLIVISHDRAFAKAVTNRVAELDRGTLFSFDCGFEAFLVRREEALAAEGKQRALFDRRLAAEEAWLRRGVKARRTRNEGRVQALLEMRAAYQERRTRAGLVNLNVRHAGRSGNLVIEARDLLFAYPPDEPTGNGAGRPIIDGFSTTIMRGDKVGIVGPNGAGKTTLIRLLLGELQPQRGSVRTGTNLQPLYLDQVRSSLDPHKTVIENLSGGDDMIMAAGKSRHINAYLQDFLFEPDRARCRVSALSGGEANRLLLAKLFAQPSNLLIMDEPTNDLDMETLDLLEEQLLAYPGTVLLVSHDREFLDNLVTDCLVFAPDGRIEEFVGGYSDWRARHQAMRSAPAAAEKRSAAKKPASENTAGTQAARGRKLSFNEARELQSLPDTITVLEAEVEAIHQSMADPEFYRREGERVAGLARTLAQLETELAAAYQRWEELDGVDHSA